MPFKVKCPGCGAVHEVGPEMAGTRAQCRCGKVIVIPQLGQRAAPAPQPGMLDDDMLGPPSQPEPHPEQLLDEPQERRVAKRTWRYEETKKALTGKQIGMAVAGILLGLAAVVGAVFFATSHALAIRDCVAALGDKTYTREFGSARAIAELIVNAVLLLPAFLMVLAGLGIIVTSVLELVKPEWRFEWADMCGAVAGAAYASLLFLALMVRAVIDLGLKPEIGKETGIETEQLVGTGAEALLLFVLAAIAPVMLIACYWIRRPR